MNNKIKIVADSTCDLSQELIEKYDIDIIPLYIVLENESFMDGIEIKPDDIYKWSDKNKKTPKTAAPEPGVVMDVLSKYDKEKRDVIFFGISEDMSTTCNVIRLMAAELENIQVKVIDSMNLSTGIGLQVISAEIMAQNGMSIDDIVEKIEGQRARVRASFVVDTLTYLQRGGRCSTVTALLGNTLQLKPKIIVKNGKMSVDKKYRGTTKSSLMKYTKDLKAEMENAIPDRVFITHSGIDSEIIEEIKKYIEELNIFEEILVTRAGGVISSHCGPNTLGVLFIEK